MVTALERIEDFSEGQFYILQTEYRESDEYLNQLLKDAKSALRQRRKLSEWGLNVALRLTEAIPPLLNPARKIVTTKAGFVYLIYATDTLYKIGCTTDPTKRLSSLSTGLPFPLSIICTIPTNDMYKTERELHNLFAAKRNRGEWFNLDNADVEYIKGLVS